MSEIKRQPIGPIKLPSGREVYCLEPLGSDRMTIMSRALAEGRQADMMFMMNGYWLPAKCLCDAQGQFTAPDYFRAFDDWSDKDVQFYRAVFDDLFGWSVENAQAAKEAAARFLPQPPAS